LDSLPKVKLPDGVDPNDENWKGIDLTPKQPVQPLTADVRNQTFLITSWLPYPTYLI